MKCFKRPAILLFMLISLWLTDGVSLSFASTSTVLVDANGNVGIGTTAPITVLTVGPGMPDVMVIAGSNDVYVAGNLEFDGNIYADGSQLTNLNIVSGWTRSGQNVYTTGTGNVGIGTTVPGPVFDVAGNINLQDTMSSVTGVIYKGADRFIHNFRHPTGDTVPPEGHNTFIGIGAGNFTMGEGSVYQGYGCNNTGVGWYALLTNYDGGSNTAAGYQALYSNNYNYQNVAVGAWTLYLNSSGASNTATGNRAQQNNISGSGNIANGANTLQYNETGNDNTIMGSEAGGVGVGTTSGANIQNTVAIGYRAGYMLGTGDNNILFGYRAADNLTTGDNNIVIGYDVDAPSATSANTLNIGNLLFGTGLNGTGTTLATGNIGIGTSVPLARLAVVGTGQALGRVFGVYNSAYRPNVIVLDNGNIGIGTSVPMATLEIQPSTGMPALLVSTSSIDGDYLVINSAANVGIRNASPQLKLDVYGSAIIKGASSSGIEGELVYDDAANYYKYYDGTQWQQLTGGTIGYSATLWDKVGNYIYYDDGNVGIGTALPDHLLALRQAADSDGIRINGFDDQKGSYGEIHITSSGDMRIRSNAEMLFDIAGTNFIPAWTNFTHYRNVILVDDIPLSTGTDSDYSLGYNSADDTFRIADGADLTAAPRLILDAAGNVGIGTFLPVGVLDVEHKLVVLSGGNVGVGTTAPLAMLQVGTGTPSMTLATPLGTNDALVKGRLEVDGNVLVTSNLGIGTAFPDQRLTVNGSVNLVSSNNGYMLGDSSLGVFWPSGTNDISFVSLSSGRVRLTADGNVGVGTTAPAAGFQVGVGAPSMAAATPWGVNDALFKGKIQVDSHLFVNGNVGVGTTTPATTAQISYLDNSITTVSNGLSIHNRASPTGTWAGVRFSAYPGASGGYYPKQFIGGWRSPTSAGSGDIVFMNRSAADNSVVAASDERMRITRYGNVGIGTTEPVSLLHLGGGAVPNVMNITGADAYIKGNLEVDGKIYGDASWITGIQWTTSGNDIYYTAGNVGVGVTAPTAVLKIGAGSVDSGYGLYVSSPVEFDGSIYVYAPVYFLVDNMPIQNNYYLSSETNDLKYASGLNTVFSRHNYRHIEHDHPPNADPFIYVQSGTSPDVSNNQWGALTHNTADLVLSTGVNVGTGTAPTTTENAIVFSPRGTEALRVSGAGNVGIGTTEPSATLDVVGSLEIPHSVSPSLTVDGQIALETDSDSINIQVGVGTTGMIPVNTDVAIPLIQQKDVTLMEPDKLITLEDQVAWFAVDPYNFPSGITITAVRVAVSASSTDTYTIEEWTDPATYSKDIVSVALSAATEGTATTITSASVSAGSYVFIDLDDAQDNINWCKLTIWFYVND